MKKNLMLLDPLRNIEKPRFNGVYSRDKLLRIKDGAYFMNLDGKQSKGTYWVLLFYWQKYSCLLWFLWNWKTFGRGIKVYKLYKIKVKFKIMILLYVNFIVSLSLNIISGKTLLDYTNLFFSNGCKKNGKIIYKWFKEKYGLRKRKP